MCPSLSIVLGRCFKGMDSFRVISTSNCILYRLLTYHSPDSMDFPKILDFIAAAAAKKFTGFGLSL